jgi:hypothetical protein
MPDRASARNGGQECRARISADFVLLLGIEVPETLLATADEVIE